MLLFFYFYGLIPHILESFATCETPYTVRGVQKLLYMPIDWNVSPIRSGHAVNQTAKMTSPLLLPLKVLLIAIDLAVSLKMLLRRIFLRTLT